MPLHAGVSEQESLLMEHAKVDNLQGCFTGLCINLFSLIFDSFIHRPELPMNTILIEYIIAQKCCPVFTEHTHSVLYMFEWSMIISQLQYML